MQPYTQNLNPDDEETWRIASDLAALKEMAVLRNERNYLIQWLNLNGRDRANFADHLQQNKQAQLAEKYVQLYT